MTPIRVLRAPGALIRSATTAVSARPAAPREYEQRRTRQKMCGFMAVHDTEPAELPAWIADSWSIDSTTALRGVA